MDFTAKRKEVSMPLNLGRGCKSKACKQKAVSQNIDELTHHGTKKRSHEQIVAIALSSVYGKKKKK